ncbi:MAG: hypothetical protein L6R40_004632 [Gallowayella cf. fulva]|nr:MAG: hypothetical protein L6R40_004632 [Xanthomendoza cf. fulva]
MGEVINRVANVLNVVGPRATNSARPDEAQHHNAQRDEDPLSRLLPASSLRALFETKLLLRPLAAKPTHLKGLKATEATRVRMRRRPKWPSNVLKHGDLVPNAQVLNAQTFSATSLTHPAI